MRRLEGLERSPTFRQEYESGAWGARLGGGGETHGDAKVAAAVESIQQLEQRCEWQTRQIEFLERARLGLANDLDREAAAKLALARVHAARAQFSTSRKSRAALWQFPKSQSLFSRRRGFPPLSLRERLSLSLSFLRDFLSLSLSRESELPTPIFFWSSVVSLRESRLLPCGKKNPLERVVWRSNLGAS